MNNNNGKWITKFLVGALWFVIITAIITLCNYTIANDKESRQRDGIIRIDMLVLERKIVSDINHIKETQGDKLTNIEKTLVKLETQLQLENKKSYERNRY